MKYRSEIDGLRALAVMSVIIYHFNRDILPSGYLGVDIFFVISGYVITSSLVRRKGYDGLQELLLEFYAKRIKRLVPAMLFFVIITSLLVSIFVSNNSLSLRTAIASLFGLSNIYLLKQANDYFGILSELNVFLHTWSLGVEEQFYLLFPFLVWFFGTRKRSQSDEKLTIAIGVITLVSFVIFVYLCQVDRPAAYYLMPARLWELGAGCLVFLIEQKKVSYIDYIKNTAPLLSVIAIVVVLFLPLHLTVEATLLVVMFTMVLILSARTSTIGYRLLTTHKLVLLGKMSYSLYLWHWVVISLSLWTIGVYWWTFPFQFGIMLFMAIVSYRYVEVPLRYASWSRARGITVFYGISLLIIGALLVYFFSISNNFLYAGQHGKAKAIELSVDKVSVNSEFDSENGMILLAGDSHASHFTQMFVEVGRKLNMRLRVVSEGASAFPTVNISTPVGGLTYARNQRTNQRMLEMMRNALDAGRTGANNVIILSSFYRFYFETPVGARRYQILAHYDNAGNRITQRESFQLWVAALKDFARENKDASIVIILSTPEMPNIYPANVCQKEWFRPYPSDNCSISILRSNIESNLSSLNMVLRETALKLSNVYVYDPLPALCDEALHYCSSHSDGKRLFLDEDHLTPYGSSLLIDSFVDFLQSNSLVD